MFAEFFLFYQGAALLELPGKWLRLKKQCSYLDL
jgi:hypothetical protein